ncbi:hypothetical protein AXI76_gp158 [Pseudoalteromonas phage H101]|uniref:Uncharacterized protein n=1 Tax=Pseudoalteromonas phage H101 TaxID=1654919 RepID=A0A0H4INA9_9CAUD|nr:hypothetical protein AXI76_gp158 [Pseudoalteromonas phage H101]AKO61059.1 hypothetical protein [Pseudoalteromonas phage H101]
MTKVYNPEEVRVTIQGKEVKPCINYHLKRPLLMTSADWKETLCPELVILDPDGWDRSNYEYSFNEELISEKEFIGRLIGSTVMVGGL